MNRDFKNEIIEIAHSYKKRDELKSEELHNHPYDSSYLQAIDNLFSISQQAVEIFNSQLSSDLLAVYMIPKEFLEIFLDIPGRRGGFCIISTTKIVVFFDEDPNTITIIGKNRNKQRGANPNSTKVIQLLKATFSDEEGGFKYQDNTGGQLNPYDIVEILIGWIVS